MMRRLVMSKINSINSPPVSTHMKKTAAAATNKNNKNNHMTTAPAATASTLPASPPGPSQAQPSPDLRACAALATHARTFYDRSALIGSSRQAAQGALLAVLQRCEKRENTICDNIHTHTRSDVHPRGDLGHEDRSLMDNIKAGTTALEDALNITYHFQRVLKEDLLLISDALLAADWETIAHLFNAAVADVAFSKEVPALQGYALPAEEIAAVARDVGHPLRGLVSQISYAEHGAIDVSGLYRQVRHAAYAPPVVVPDAEVAAFAQCLLQQTGALEHALATSVTVTGAAAAETTLRRPKKTKRPRSARSSSGTNKEESGNDPATDALLTLFNQAVRASVPTCAEWAFTDAIIADVTAAARAVILSSRDRNVAKEDDNDKPTTQDSATPATAAARRVLEALVAANGRILGTITIQGAPPPPMPASMDGGQGNATTTSITEAARGLTARPTWFTHSWSSYRADTVYVRAVYEELWAQLSDPQRSFGWDLPGAASLSPVLLLVGSPGIGKSWALNYLLYRAVTEERAGCPKRLVMLLTRHGFWAFLPDGRVLELREVEIATGRGPPQRLVEQLVKQYATSAIASYNLNRPPTTPLSTTATAGGKCGAGAAIPPALFLYDAEAYDRGGRRMIDEAAKVPAAMIVPNMITVMTPSLPTIWESSEVPVLALKDVRALVAHRVVETFYVPPFGEHEFKAFFKGHVDVERALEEIEEEKKKNDDAEDDGRYSGGSSTRASTAAATTAASGGGSTTSAGGGADDAATTDAAASGGGEVEGEGEKAAAAEALVAETFEKYGGVMWGAFDARNQKKVMEKLFDNRRGGGPQLAHHCFRRDTQHEIMSMVPKAPTAADRYYTTNHHHHRKNSDYALAFRSPYLAQQFAQDSFSRVGAVHTSHRETVSVYRQCLRENETLKDALQKGFDGRMQADTNPRALAATTTTIDVSNAIATHLLEPYQEKCFEEKEAAH